MLCCRHGTTLLAERIGKLNAAMEDSEVETGGALRRGMQLMNRAMMRPDNAAAAGDDYKDASDAEAELASTDEVMVDLVQRNIAVMEGKYISTSSSSTSSSSSATDVSSGSVAGPSAAEATAAESPAAAAAAAAKKRKSSGGGGGRDVRREQSLGHLSAVFVQMFLANDARVVSLEEAARWLLRSNLQQQSVTDSTQQQQLSDPRRADDSQQGPPVSRVSCCWSLVVVASIRWPIRRR